MSYDYTIELLQDLVKEAWEEHSTGLPIKDFALFEDKDFPKLFYGDTQVSIASWDMALKLYQKMRDPNNRVYYAAGFPSEHVTYQPKELLIVANSREEALSLAESYTNGVMYSTLFTHEIHRHSIIPEFITVIA